MSFNFPLKKDLCIHLVSNPFSKEHNFYLGHVPTLGSFDIDINRSLRPFFTILGKFMLKE